MFKDTVLKGWEDKENAIHQAGFKPTACGLRGVRTSAVLQTLSQNNFIYVLFYVVKRKYGQF